MKPEIRASSPRSLRLIAFGRLVLIAPLAAWLLLDHANIAQPTATMLILAYSAYASVLVVLLHYRQLAYRVVAFPLGLHFVDFALATALVYASSGADTPFFGPLVFLTVSATVQWGFRGTVLTGLAVLLAYLPTGVLAFAQGKLHGTALLQFTVRLGYLGAIIVLLAALARHFERIVSELGSLSDVFPAPHDSSRPPVHDILCHAMRVFSVDSTVVAWRKPGARTVHLLTHDKLDGFAEATVEVDPALPLVAGEGHAALLAHANSGSFVRVDGRVVAGPRKPFAAPLVEALHFGRALAIRAACDGVDGWILVLEHRDAAIEDLAIAAMVSAQVCVELDRWRNQRERDTIVATAERARLGRDLHDGVVQFLAGVGFQLDTLAGETISDRGRATLAKLREALSREQRELRRLIQHARPVPARAAPTCTLSAELETLGEQLAGQWGVRVRARVTPPAAHVPERIAADIGFLVREGVANAVRHGHATAIDLVAHAEDECLVLEIGDNGAGFGFDGERAHSDLLRGATGPRSLFERTCQLGGFMSIASAATGAQVGLTIPLAEPA